MDILFDQSIKTYKNQQNIINLFFKKKNSTYLPPPFFLVCKFPTKNLTTVQFIQVRKVEEAVTGEDSVLPTNSLPTVRNCIWPRLNSNEQPQVRKSVYGGWEQL